MPRYYIGIDPDIELNGVAIWDSEYNRFVQLCKLRFFELFDLLKQDYAGEDLKVIIDAGWLNKSNFHARAEQTHRVSAQIGERTGANHEVGKKLGEMCKYLNKNFEFHRPTRSKISSDYFKKITGHTMRTSQDVRDAAMLVFGR